MKNINKIIALSLCSLMAFSCSMYLPDNFDAPDCTISGSIVDQEGNPIQVEYGGGARIKLMDIGYSDTPQEQYLNVKGDGTFINTKIFNSTYDIVAEGPFVPLVQVDAESNIIVDETLRGVTKKHFKDIKFTVEPFFVLDWAAEPVVNADGTVTVKFSLKRGTDNATFMKNVKEISLFVSEGRFVGNGDRNFYLTKTVKDAEANAMLGNETNVLTSLNDVSHPIERGRPYYIRVGAKMDHSGAYGADHFNYTTVKKIVFPKN